MNSIEQPPYPYSDIIDGLVKSTMRSQRIVLQHIAKHGSTTTLPRQAINSQFSWLCHATGRAANRHLVAGTAAGLAPLLTSKLRAKTSTPKILLDAFARREFPLVDLDGVFPPEFSEYAQQDETRISSLLIRSYIDLRTVPAASNQPPYCEIRSPLSIVYDFLTIPEVPASRAYSLLACRNYLFTQLHVAPSLDGKRGKHKFMVADVDRAFSHIWTSFSERHNSRGEDKLPISGSSGGLVRQFLAMKEMLYLRFTPSESKKSKELWKYFSPSRSAQQYLATESLIPLDSFLAPTGVAEPTTISVKCEYAKSPLLHVLPEASEVVNELWGLPLALRGADVLFKGGIRFSQRQGLVTAIHGGPGTGKTSLALAIAASVVPYGIKTWFLTAEESADDLRERLSGLLPDAITRLSFFQDKPSDAIVFTDLALSRRSSFEALSSLEKELKSLAIVLEERRKARAESDDFVIPKPCEAVIILDGLHDLFATGQGLSDLDDTNPLARMYGLVETLRELRALVILTTGIAWAGDSALDYLVDVAMRLSYESTDQYGIKPDRRVTLTKARYQLCASGTHGIQIGGSRGVRFSPQINYQLEKRAVWKARLPNTQVVRLALRRAKQLEFSDLFTTNGEHPPPLLSLSRPFVDSPHSVNIYDGSHVFLNGQGSGGKAALALKIALSPRFQRNDSGNRICLPAPQKVLIVSFLYPEKYYENLLASIEKGHALEYRGEPGYTKTLSRIFVLHLYPGHLKPHDLYNKIEWALEAAELLGDPFTSVVIEGIHNVFLQFPRIEEYGLFWPQIYSALRSRNITTITTHTTLTLPFQDTNNRQPSVDDNRSVPLRHALVQKTDFQFEIDPWLSSPFRPMSVLHGTELTRFAELFVLKTVSAIGQRIPTGYLLWSREDMCLYDFPIEKFNQQYSSSTTVIP